MNTTTRRNAAAIRVALAHLDPRPLTGDWMMRRLRDVVTIHDLPGWSVDTGADPDGQTWAAVSWRRPRGEYTVRVALTRYAPRNLSARVGRIRELEAQGRLNLTRQAPTPPPAEEVELPTEFGDVILNPRWGARSYARAVHLGEGVWAAEVTPGADVYTHLARDLCGATLLDGTRARRDGKHEDGTPRFIQAQEGEK